MLAHILDVADVPFAAHIGGRDMKFGNGFYRGNDVFVCEACEYKKNFLLLRPDIAVVLNSAPDHLECYGTEENLRAAYIRFAEGADIAVTLEGDIGVNGVTFGYGKRADYSARNISENLGRYSFTLYECGAVLGEIALNVYGKHNILNALAAAAAARSAGVSFSCIKRGIEAFNGVERRFEEIGTLNGADCIADYAHHPDEIRATLRTVKKIAKGRVYVIFQPHTYSRTKNLFREFIAVLSTVPRLMIYRTFAAREYFDEGGSALLLSRNVKKSRYGDDVRDVKNFIAGAKEGDLVLFLGAGDIYDLAKELIRNQN